MLEVGSMFPGKSPPYIGTHFPNVGAYPILIRLWTLFSRFYIIVLEEVVSLYTYNS